MVDVEESQRSALYEVLRYAPKPQLHLHLDGSISYKFIKDSMERMKREQPEGFHKLFPDRINVMTENELLDWIWKNKEQERLAGDVSNAYANWKVFDFCNQFLQTRKNLQEATYDLVTRMSNEYNVNYIEIRFAPCLHTTCGLSQRDAVDIVLESFNNAKDDLSKSGIEISGGIILSALRSFPVEDASVCLDLVRDTDALGFDIAGDEGSYPLSAFKNILAKAKDLGIPMSIHCGEWDCTKYPSVLDNIRLAAEIGVERIGHGLAVTHASKEAIKTMKQKNIGIEVCLTGNCGNKDRCNSFKEHPLPEIIDMGLKVVALNCDDTLVEGSREVGVPEPVKECIRALLDVKITPEQLISIIKNGYQSGFAKNADLFAEKSIKIWREKYLQQIENVLKESM